MRWSRRFLVRSRFGPRGPGCRSNRLIFLHQRLDSPVILVRTLRTCRMPSWHFNVVGGVLVQDVAYNPNFHVLQARHAVRLQLQVVAVLKAFFKVKRFRKMQAQLFPFALSAMSFVLGEKRCSSVHLHAVYCQTFVNPMIGKDSSKIFLRPILDRFLVKPFIFFFICLCNKSSIPAVRQPPWSRRRFRRRGRRRFMVFRRCFRRDAVTAWFRRGRRFVASQEGGLLLGSAERCFGFLFSFLWDISSCSRLLSFRSFAGPFQSSSSKTFPFSFSFSFPGTLPFSFSFSF